MGIRWGWVVWLGLAVVAMAVTWPRQDWTLLKARLLNQQAIANLGFGGYLGFDVISTSVVWWKRSQISRLDPSPYREFLQAHARESHNPVSPTPGPRKHVIYLQLESVDGLVIDGRWEGEPIMPFVESLAHEGVYFTNALDNTASGRTTDGEFLVLTSQVPLPRPPVFVTEQLDRIPSMPRILGEAGYYSLSMHGFNGAFWNRANAHAALGYDEMVFEEDLDLTQRIGWGWSDKDVLQAAAARVIAAEQPLFLHAITLTNHHPYDYVAKLTGATPGTIEDEYVRTLRFVDDSIRDFFATLDAAGVRENCLIVIYSDHDSAITETLAPLVSVGNKIHHPDSVPLIMVGFDRPPQKVEGMAGLQDVPVMVLEELGIPVPITFTGNGWGRWGRTRSAQHGGWQNAGPGIVRWESPVDPKLTTLMAIQRPEDLLP